MAVCPSLSYVPPYCVSTAGLGSNTVSFHKHVVQTASMSEFQQQRVEYAVECQSSTAFAAEPGVCVRERQSYSPLEVRQSLPPAVTPPRSPTMAPQAQVLESAPFKASIENVNPARVALPILAEIQARRAVARQQEATVASNSTPIPIPIPIPIPLVVEEKMPTPCTAAPTSPSCPMQGPDSEGNTDEDEPEDLRSRRMGAQHAVPQQQPAASQASMFLPMLRLAEQRNTATVTEHLVVVHMQQPQQSPPPTHLPSPHPAGSSPAQTLLEMLGPNRGMDLGTVQNVLDSMGGDMQKAAEHLISMQHAVGTRSTVGIPATTAGGYEVTAAVAAVGVGFGDVFAGSNPGDAEAHVDLAMQLALAHGQLEAQSTPCFTNPSNINNVAQPLQQLSADLEHALLEQEQQLDKDAALAQQLHQEELQQAAGTPTPPTPTPTPGELRHRQQPLQQQEPFVDLHSAAVMWEQQQVEADQALAQQLHQMEADAALAQRLQQQDQAAAAAAASAASAQLQAAAALQQLEADAALAQRLHQQEVQMHAGGAAGAAATPAAAAHAQQQVEALLTSPSAAFDSLYSGEHAAMAQHASPSAPAGVIDEHGTAQLLRAMSRRDLAVPKRGNSARSSSTQSSGQARRRVGAQGHVFSPALAAAAAACSGGSSTHSSQHDGAASGELPADLAAWGLGPGADDEALWVPVTDDMLQADALFTLRRYFAAVFSEDELRLALAAAGGDADGAIQTLLAQQDEAKDAKAAQAAADEELAKQLHHEEEQKAAGGRAGADGVEDAEGLQQMLADQVVANARVQAAPTHTHPLLRSSQQLDMLEMAATGAWPPAAPPAAGRSSADGSGAWQASPGNSIKRQRCVKRLQEMFGPAAGTDLLQDLLSSIEAGSSSSMVEAAAGQLLAMGLQPRQQQPLAAAGAGFATSVFAAAATRRFGAGSGASSSGSASSRGSSRDPSPPPPALAARYPQASSSQLLRLPSGGALAREEGLSALGRQARAQLSTAGRVSHEMLQEMYKEYRAPASAMRAELRQLLDDAQAAYLAGDKHYALELRAQADEVRGRIGAADEDALQRIFELRNAGVTNRFEIDFHGLHVNEALRKLTELYNMWQMMPTRKILRVITGRGKHSPGEPKLLNAVRAWLEERGITDFVQYVGHFDIAVDAPVDPA